MLGDRLAEGLALLGVAQGELEGALGDGPSDDSALYALAEEKLAGAAAASDLLDRAEDNTREMLTTLAQSLGIDEVTVEFEAPAGATG